MIVTQVEYVGIREANPHHINSYEMVSMKSGLFLLDDIGSVEMVTIKSGLLVTLALLEVTLVLLEVTLALLRWFI